MIRDHLGKILVLIWASISHQIIEKKISNKVKAKVSMIQIPNIQMIVKLCNLLVLMI
jgi:hypothetical protein